MRLRSGSQSPAKPKQQESVSDINTRMSYELTPSEAKKLKTRNQELHHLRILQLKRLVGSHEYHVPAEEIADGILKDKKFGRYWS